MAERWRERTVESLSAGELRDAHRMMVRARVAEEALIALYRRGDGFFWIGGPGEEAFNVPLGLQLKKGFGPDNDYLHFHYRQSATFIAMGGDPKDLLRQQRSTASDPFSRGRNFSNHIVRRDWNIMPVTSTIGTQYSQAPGTAWVQRRHGGDGITIVTGGDAGAAEGDFATCLIWSARPKQEVPILIIVANNEYGISTRRDTQWPMRDIVRRAEAFDIPWKSIDGNDFFESWEAIREAMAYVRTERRPYALQANVSRLHGHSSASGAARVEDERDSLAEFEQALVERGISPKADLETVWDEERETSARDVAAVRKEAFPEPESIFEHIYAGV